MTIKQKISAVFRILKKLVGQPESIFLVLKDENEYRNYLKRKFNVNEFPTIDIRKFLPENKSIINNYTFLEGGSMVTDLALLKSVAALFPECEYLEIGTWRGESIVNVADVPGVKCTSVNLSSDEIISMGFPEKYAQEHGCLIRNRENIHSVFANSRCFDFGSLGKKFDLVFIDGDHSYDGVLNDTRKVLPLLNDERSVIIWHDYSFDPVSPRYSVISAILDGMPAEYHKHLFHVSNTMCAIFYRQELPSSSTDRNPDKVFRINIEALRFPN